MKIFLFQVHLFRVNTKMSNTLINIMLIYLGVVAASAVAAAAGTRGAQFCSDEELRGGTELQDSAPPFTLEVRLQHTTASGIQTTQNCLLAGLCCQTKHGRPPAGYSAPQDRLSLQSVPPA